MPSLNEVTLIGHLGSDPKISQTHSGKQVVNVSIATTERDQTEWHRLIIWEKDADTASKYLRKGSLIWCRGRLQTRSWEDQSGQKRSTTEISVSRFLMLDKAKVKLNTDEAEERDPRTLAVPQKGASDSTVDDDLPF